MKSSIQVFADVAGSKIACYHTIRVDHWNDVENEKISHNYGFLRITQQIPHKSFQNVRGVSLAWMNSSTDDGNFFRELFF